jgi:branched-chain amino acid transport system substrate-binding protein
MKLKNLLLFGLIFLFIASCGRKEETIKIGAILPLTGTGADFGKCARNAYEYAIKKLNDTGGINGKKIDFLVEDSQGDARVGVQAFNKLVNYDHAQIIISTISGVTLALIPLVNKYEILLFTDAAHPKIVENTKNVFRHSNIATDEAKVAIEKLFSIPQKKMKISMLAVNDDYGISILNSVKNELPDTGKLNFLSYQLYDKNQTDFRTIISSLLRDKPTSVIIAGYGKPAGLLIKTLREQGYNGIILTTLPFIATPSGISVAANSLLNTYYITFSYEDDNEPNNFRLEYEKQFGEKPLANAVLSYSILQIIESGLRKYGTDILLLKNYFRNLKNFNALSGKINSDSLGNMPAQLTVKQFDENLINK